MIHQNRRENHIVGQVIEINWRTTRLKTTEKNMIVVPNSKMGEAILTNYMRPNLISGSILNSFSITASVRIGRFGTYGSRQVFGG